MVLHELEDEISLSFVIKILFFHSGIDQTPCHFSPLSEIPSSIE